MFKFLTLFRKLPQEVLDENDYDFNELPVSENTTTRERIENQPTSLVSERAENPRVPIQPLLSPTDHALQEKHEALQINKLTDMLHDIANTPDSPKAPSLVTENRSPLDGIGIDHDFIKRYRPKFLGNGGENIVYELPGIPEEGIKGHPDIVVKVAVDPLLDQIQSSNGRAITYETEQKVALGKLLLEEQFSYHELVAYYGRDHVPTTRKYVLDVPVSKHLLEEIYRKKRASIPAITLDTNEMATIVTIQEKVPHISENSVDVTGGFAELWKKEDIERRTSMEKYKKAYEATTQSLICTPESSPFDRDSFLVLYPGLKKMFDWSDSDPKLKLALTEFVQHSFNYTKETGKGLDLIGANNIVFFKNNEDWNYKLLDALHPNSEKALDDATVIMRKINGQQPLRDGEAHKLTAAVNYVRIMNGLAKYLGSSAYIPMPQGETIDPSKLWELLHETHFSTKTTEAVA